MRLIGPPLVAIALAAVVGCSPPRVKSLESYQSAVETNPPRDFNAAPVDSHGYAGIADGTGGLNPETQPAGKPERELGSVYLSSDGKVLDAGPLKAKAKTPASGH